MKKTGIVLAVAVCALAVVSTSALAAKGDKKEGAEKKANKPTLVVGALGMTTDDAGKVTSVTIVDKDAKAYNVVLDGFTQDVKALVGQQVNAKGDVKDVEGKSMLTVKGEIKAVPVKKEKKDKKEGAEQKANKPTLVVGALGMTTDDAGKVTSVTIVDKDAKAYNVVLDGFTQDVKAFVGQQVNAVGEVKDVDGKSMLTVKGKIKAIPVKKEKKEGKVKKEKKDEAAPAPAAAPAAE